MATITDYNIDRQFKAKVLHTERQTPADTDEIRELQLEVEDPNFTCSVNQSFGYWSSQMGPLGTITIIACTAWQIFRKKPMAVPGSPCW